MSKQTKGFALDDFEHVTSIMLDRAQRVVTDKSASRYSVSGIYKSHNELFKLTEQPQSCDSCLVQRATKIANWHAWYSATKAGKPLPIQVPVPATPDDPAASAAGASVAIDEALKGLHLSEAENAELYAAMGLTDDNTTQDYYAKLVELAAGKGDANDTLSAEEWAKIDNKIAALKIALDEADEIAAGITAKNAELAKQQATDDGLPAVAEGATRIILQRINKDTYEQQGDPLYGDYVAPATPEAKGKVTDPATGKALPMGTYATEDSTKVLTVGMGGAATYKSLAQ